MGTSSSSRQERLRFQLQRLADALNTVPEALLEGAQQGTYGDDEAEMVRAWFKIADPEDRRLILRLARKAAGER